MMNARLVQLGLILTLVLAIVAAVPIAGLAYEGSLPAVSVAPAAQVVPTTTPASQQGSRYSQYMARKKALTTTPAATATPAPVNTPEPPGSEVTSESADTGGESLAPTPVLPVLSNALVGGERLQKVTGDRLSSTMYAFDNDGALLRSTDGGITWEPVADASDVKEFVMSPAEPMVLYGGQGLDCEAASAGSSAGSDETTAVPLYRSTDGGISWEPLTLGDNLVPLLAAPQDADTLLTADCELPYLSTNGGDSWQSKPDRTEVALWDTYRINEVTLSSLVGQSSVDTANWNYLYASGTDEEGASVVAYSGDAGDTWERITPRISPQPRAISSVTADPTTAGRLWFTDRNGVWYTDDFGASWQLTILGLADVLNAGDKLGVTGLTDILYLSSDDVYLATIEGLYRGKPDSGNWTLVEDGEFGTQAIESLLVTESQPGVLWVNAEDGVYVYPVQ